MRLYANRMMTEEEIVAYRERKKLGMRKLRENPISHENIKKRTREWYRNSGRKERQKKYLQTLREQQFFKWRTKLFNQHYGTQFKVVDLQTVWEKQHGRCYLTGVELDKTAQIDHILPLKTGGNNELNNLRWVTKEANFAKRNLTNDDFLELCKNVVEFLGSKLNELLLQSELEVA